MSDVLIPEQVLAEVDQDLKRVLASSGETFAVDPDNAGYGAAFRRHLLFSRWPSLLEGVGVNPTAEELLYNSYYWILKFSKLYGLRNGYDAGIEQQVFKVLENADCDVDWAVVEQITNLVEQELGEGT